MADKKITALTALTSLADADLFAVVDDVAGTPVTKKIVASDVATYVAGSSVFTSAVGTPIDETLIDAKGDLIVGSAADTAVRLAVGGTNGHVLTVNSAATNGVEWAAVPASPVDSDQAVLSGAVFN